MKHKFYQLWSAGSLSMEDLQGYSKEYFQLVKAVPSLVGNILEQVTPELEPNFEHVNVIKHNLEEEKAAYSSMGFICRIDRRNSK